jgi:hypothetical protein
MRVGFVFLGFAGLAIAMVGQQPGAEPSGGAPQSAPASFAEDLKAPAVSAEAKLRQMFERKIEAEWEAIKNKDKKAYGDFLADDYEGVEIDSKGERSKTQAMNELANGNLSSYVLWGFKLTPLGTDAAFTVYEVTMQFPPKSQVRFSRIYVGAVWMKRAGEWEEVHYQETHVK